jgi:CRISPR-associated protein Csa3
MTRFVSPIGFSGNRVTRPIIARGLTAGDEVVLLSPKQADPGAQEQTEQAIHDVKDTLSGVVHQVTVTTQELSTTGFAVTIDRISQILVDDPPPVVCLGAGATDIALPTAIATFAHHSYVQDVMMFSDLERSGTIPEIPDLTARIPGRTRDVFRALANQEGESPATVSELADAAGRSVSTASRHVDALADQNLVEKQRTEQAKTVSLTLTGQLFARNLLRGERE